jgi:hypothetical protein
MPPKPPRQASSFRWAAGADWSFYQREALATHKRNGRRLLCGLPVGICFVRAEMLHPGCCTSVSTAAGTILLREITELGDLSARVFHFL